MSNYSNLKEAIRSSLSLNEAYLYNWNTTEPTATNYISSSVGYREHGFNGSFFYETFYNKKTDSYGSQFSLEIIGDGNKSHFYIIQILDDKDNPKLLSKNEIKRYKDAVKKYADAMDAAQKAFDNVLKTAGQISGYDWTKVPKRNLNYII